MTWFRLDDGGTFHPKVLKARNEAWGAFCRAGQWCAKYLTDGYIPVELALAIAPKRVWARLDSVGLVEKTSRKFGENSAGIPSSESIESLLLHDYLDWNYSRVEVMAERDRKSHNVREFRERRKRLRASAEVGNDIGNASGNELGSKPAGNHVPDPDPDPDQKQQQPRAALRNGSVAPRKPPVAPRLEAPEPDDGDPFEPAPPAPRPSDVSGREQQIADEIRAHRCFAGFDAVSVAKAYESATMTASKPVDWVRFAIRECAAKHAEAGLLPEVLRRTLIGFMLHARRPKGDPQTDPVATASQEPQETAHDREVREARRRDREEAARILAERAAQSPPGPEHPEGKPQ